MAFNDRISAIGKSLFVFSAVPIMIGRFRGKSDIWFTEFLLLQGLGDLFRLDPKNEPEKGFILIGLGLAIIFIILISVWYYRRKNSREKTEKRSKIEPGPEKIDVDKEKKTDNKRVLCRPPSKSIERLQEKLETGSSYSRKKGLRSLEKIMAEEPENIVFFHKGLKECLSDPDTGVRKGSVKMVRAGARSHPDEFVEFIEPLLGLLEGDNEAVSGIAGKALLAFGKNSDGACLKIIQYSDDLFSKIMERDEEPADKYLSLGVINKMLKELGTRRQNRIEAIMKVMSRNIGYPIYRPEIDEEEGEELFISTALFMGELIELSPDSARTAIPKVIKILGDTYSYEKWKEDAYDAKGMRRTFEDLFNGITAGEPGVAVPVLVKNLSATNEMVKKIVRERLTGLSREDPGSILPLLMECLGSNDGSVKKNAMSMLASAALVDPALGVNIMIGSLTSGNRKIIPAGARVLRDLLDKLEEPSIDDVGPLIGLLDEKDHEVRQEVVGLLGKIVEKDPQKANECIGHILKALKQEWGIRLVALASLESLSLSDDNLRRFSIPYIIERLRDEHDQVRWRASNILKKLGIDEKDVKYFESARRQMDLAIPKIKELKEGTSLDLVEIQTELAKAKEMMKLTDYGKADLHATRTKEMLLELQSKNKPELDVSISSGSGFVVGKHTPFALTVLNKGMVHIYEPSFRFSDNVEIIRSPASFLKAGSFSEMSLAWTPERSGRMPIKVSGTFRDKSGVEGEFGKDIWVDVRMGGAEEMGGAEGTEGSSDVVRGVMWEMVFV